MLNPIGKNSLMGRSETSTMVAKMIEPWMFVAMEEYGITDTNDGLINRVALYLANGKCSVIDEEEFRSACLACDVDPDSFTQSDLTKLKKRLSEL